MRYKVNEGITDKKVKVLCNVSFAIVTITN